MVFKKCSRCNKRPAVVSCMIIENGVKKQAGLCLQCAEELGIDLKKAMMDQLSAIGIDPNDPQSLENAYEGMLEQLGAITNGGESGNIEPVSPDENNKIDFDKLFSGLKPSGKENNKKNDKNTNGTDNKRRNSILDAFCRNLTELARQGKLDDIIGRDAELKRVTGILMRRQKNNPCLIGEPGVGKTAIAEALANKIAKGDVPYRLQNCELYLCDIAALVAGTQFRGQFEQRLLNLVKEVKERGNVILVIDEVHNLAGAGESEGGMNAANILKPALSRGEIRVIGATTLKEYRKYIEKDAALERRFQPVTVNEPNIEQTVEMLRKIKHYYEEYHRMSIPDELLVKAVTMSERYITDRFLPDKAIDLLDEAAAGFALSCSSLDEEYKLHDKLIKIKEERDLLESNTDEAVMKMDEQRRYERIASLKAEELKYADRLAELAPEIESLTLTEEALAEVIEIWTGIPSKDVTENEYIKIDRLNDRLKTKLIGQDEAVDAVCRAIKRKRANVSAKRKPVSFIFAGPTGVGKTELVKQLASDLFNTTETLIRLDMSEYMEKHSVSKIIGAPPGYVGYDEAGQLTEKIRRRPYSVILFDEIEKAHSDVLNILLQILDDGRITDAQGRTVNFENTVIIMTTNAGSSSASCAGFNAGSKKTADDDTKKALLTFLRPEFINRVDEIITFRSLDVSDFEKIAVIMLEELRAVIEKKPMEFNYTSDVPALIAEKSFSAKFGARNMRRYIQTNIEDSLAEQIISRYNSKPAIAYITVENGEIKVLCM
ncbi:MAG: ATP-dependent Clp protease ATP-binding subunit [Ruminococcaceae bacterium]|nr:ATP-dependent Clp protease ATP-binding subunit [Oscillospiraceae bacterium]